MTAEVGGIALFLMSGDITDGAVLDQSGSVNDTARITRNLDAGAYAVEVAVMNIGLPKCCNFIMRYSIPRRNPHRTFDLGDYELYTVVGRPDKPAD